MEKLYEFSMSDAEITCGYVVADSMEGAALRIKRWYKEATGGWCEYDLNTIQLVAVSYERPADIKLLIPASDSE